MRISGTGRTNSMRRYGSADVEEAACDEDDDSDNEALVEKKYHSLYEQKMNPFNEVRINSCSHPLYFTYTTY